jgi:hypothetical protein
LPQGQALPLRKPIITVRGRFVSRLLQKLKEKSGSFLKA